MSAGNAMLRHAALLPVVSAVDEAERVGLSSSEDGCSALFFSAIVTATEIRAFPSFSMSGVSRYSGTMRT